VVDARVLGLVHARRSMENKAFTLLKIKMRDHDYCLTRECGVMGQPLALVYLQKKIVGRRMS